MSDRPTRSAIDAARGYEGLLVPALFGQWPPRVLAAARVRPGQRVLDVACGTGVLARAAAARVGPDGAVVGLDPDPGMLAVAAEIAPGVEWRRGRAEALPFEDGAFDAVVSQFGLMLLDDPLAALREMLRVAAPRGRVAVAVWGSLDDAPAYAAEVALLERVAGREAADALRVPFSLGDRGALERLLRNAGAAGVKVATHLARGRFPDARTMVEADLRGWLPLTGVTLPEAAIERILAEAEDVLAPFRTRRGTVGFGMLGHVVSGTRPPG